MSPITRPGTEYAESIAVKREEPKDIAKIFRDGDLIDKALNAGIRNALLQHKRAGNPVPEWRDGKVVWIPPEEIMIPPEPQED